MGKDADGREARTQAILEKWAAARGERKDELSVLVYEAMGLLAETQAEYVSAAAEVSRLNAALDAIYEANPKLKPVEEPEG